MIAASILMAQTANLPSITARVRPLLVRRYTTTTVCVVAAAATSFHLYMNLTHCGFDGDRSAVGILLSRSRWGCF
jgi:hypothetical protein